MSQFDKIWNDLLRKLKPGMVIKNWTVLKGEFNAMTIARVGQNSIEFHVPTAINPQIVPKGHFEEVYKVWEGYKIGKVKRTELARITHYSKYIISLFHWYEEEYK